MPNLNPLLLVKLVLWVAAVVFATRLLQRRKVSARVRVIMLAVGVVVFGVIYGFLVHGGPNPSPVLSLRGILFSLVAKHSVALPLLGMLTALLVVGIISNKAICGWGCQLGLLQDLLFRVPMPKWKPPFWLSNGVRALAFSALIGGIALAAFDWITPIDPFSCFRLRWSYRRCRSLV